MEYRRLRYFVTVAEELHFGRAALRLHMAQQPLSAQIRELEIEIDCTLFVRGANRVTLTPAGAILLREARSILAQTEAALQLTRRAARGEIGLLRIGHCSAALQRVIPTAIQYLKERFPDLGIAMREMRASEQLTALERGEIDVGFSYRPFDERAFDSIDVHEEGLVVGVSERHRLASFDAITALDVADEPFVALSPLLNSSTASVTAALRIADVDHSIAFQVDDKYSALSLVGNNMGFAVLPEMAAVNVANVVYRRFDCAARLTFATIWSRRIPYSPIRDRFVDAVRTLSIASA